MISKRKVRSALICILVISILFAGNIPAFAAASGKWIQSGSRWWYRHNDASYTSDDWEYISGKWYHFDSNGWMQTGWEKVNGKWYYLTSSGAMATGWEKINGKWYYLTSSGAMATGWEKVNNKWYYLNSDGAMQTGWCRWKNNTYYLKTSGEMEIGWAEIGSVWYYFDASGAMCRNQWVGSYYVNRNGEWVENMEIAFNKDIERIDIGYYEGVPVDMETVSTDSADIINAVTSYFSELNITKRHIEEKSGGSVYVITVHYADGAKENFSVLAEDSVLWYNGIPYDVDVQQIEDAFNNMK